MMKISDNKKLNIVFVLFFFLFLPSCSVLSSISFNPDGRSDLEYKTFNLVNEYRESQSLEPLEWNSDIAENARQHSRNMAKGYSDFGHDGFSARVEKIKETMEVTSAAENVAYNYGYGEPAMTAVNGWIDSDGHRRNMEGDFTLTGIGAVSNDSGKIYFTQIFVKE